MKHTLLTATVATLTTLSGFAQGVFINSNRLTTAGVDAPFYQLDGVTALDSAYVAQLWGGPTIDTIAPVSGVSPFRDGAGAGYWNAPVLERTEGVAVPGVAPGEVACLQVAFWDASYATFEEAQSGGPGAWGTTGIFSGIAGTPSLVGPPPVPAAQGERI